MTRRRVCVFAGSQAGARDEYRSAAQRFGQELARRGGELVYGGGGVGLMGVLADAALAAGGRVHGVIPRALAVKEVAHAGLTQLDVVATMHERKQRMASLADAFAALPGGLGTLEELFEVLTWAQLGIHAKPCGLLNARGYFDPLLRYLDHAVAEGFIAPKHRAMVLVAETPDALLDRLDTYTPPAVERWLKRDQI